MVKAVDGAYAGDISPQEAFELLRDEASAALVDVRTQAEWTYVGVADLHSLGKRSLLVEWQSYPGMEVNSGFVGDVEAALDQSGSGQSGSGQCGSGEDRTGDDSGTGANPIANRERALLFICRSGVRSIAAAEAMAASGYARSFNVTEGFEGGLDGEGHRGAEGWKACGLPWVQK